MYYLKVETIALEVINVSVFSIAVDVGVTGLMKEEGKFAGNDWLLVEPNVIFTILSVFLSVLIDWAVIVIDISIAVAFVFVMFTVAVLLASVLVLFSPVVLGSLLISTMCVVASLPVQVAVLVPMVELGTSLLLVIRPSEAVDDPALGGTCW